MATDLEKLVVQLSADIKGFDKELAKAVGVSNKQFNAVERRARQMNKNLDGIFAKSFKGLATPLAGVGAALGINELRKMTDTWTDMNSRITLATGSQEKGTEVMGRLGEMARRTYSDLTLTAESYLANSTALKELGYSTDQSLDYTEALNNALVVSGAKGEKAAQVQDALAKAMGLGKLSGDNLNTVLASGGRVAEALAAGLNTTVGGLRKLGSEGKITGKALVNALSSQMEVLRKEAADMPATIGDGFTLLNNALLQYVGNADSATGISAKISEALVIIADNFDKVADGALQVAAVLAGGLLGRSIIGMISNLGLGVTALKSFTQALAAAKTMGGLATAFGGLGAAAGPVGMIIGGAVVGSLLLYNSASSEAGEGARLFAERLKIVEEAAKASGEAVDEAGGKNKNYNLNSMKSEVRAAGEAFDTSKENIRSFFDALTSGMPKFQLIRDEAGKLSRVPVASAEQYQQLDRLRDELLKNAKTAGDVKAKLQELANSNPNFQSLVDQLQPLLSALINISKAASDVNAALADKITSRGRSAKDDEVKVDLNGIAAGTYEKEALRRAALGKSQLTLETEIGKVRNDALKEGITLTEQQIATIAKANIAGDASRSAEGKKPKGEKAPKKTEDDYFFQLTQQVKDRTAALAEEAKIIGLTYIEQEKRRTALELEQDVLSRLREEARKKGDKDWESIKLSPNQVSAIDAVSEAYSRQADELRKVEEAQSSAEQAAGEFYDTFKSGMVGALTGAESLQDALSGILKKLAEMILNSAFDAIFGGASASRSGGWLTGAMKAIGFADGGLPQFANGTPSRLRPGIIRGEGTGRSDSILARVSNKEFITNARSTAKHRGLLEAINEDRLPAYMDGTPSLRAPMMPILKAGNTNEQGGMRFAPVYHIDARGADQAAVDRLQRGLEKTNREMESRVVQTVRKAQKSNWKFG